MTEKNIDWDNLGFNAYKTKSMFKAYYAPTIGWQVEGLIPYGDVTLSPASTILNYGQGIFEGTKAYKTSKGRVVCFRLENNEKRFSISSERYDLIKELFCLSLIIFFICSKYFLFFSPKITN